MSRGTILVVEDDANLLAGIRDILELEHYTIITATNGEEALHWLKTSNIQPDLIVSDIMMPQMDGIELLTRLRAMDQFVSIPVIYLTAKGERKDIQRGKQLGVDDYVVKPFNADDLLIAINSRLERSRNVKRVQEDRESQLKQKILTILHHEFRTPLTFIVAYADLLNDYSNPQLDGVNQNMTDHAEMLTFLQGVQGGADRLRQLIENFITLVELETEVATHNYEVRKKSLDNLEDFLSHVAETTTARLYEDYSCSVDVEDGLSIPEADEEYLAIAITHLIENACKFSSPGDQIEITAKRLQDHISIAVRDQGRGIPEQELDKIWQSFYQVDREKHEDQGAGSGLAIVKGIAELHGGDVQLEDTHEKGSTFSIRLPINSTEPHKNELSQQTSAKLTQS